MAESLTRLSNEYVERAHWDERIKEVLACPDNNRLPRVANAGAIIDNFQVMHNGIEVEKNGYYGNGITRMLSMNRGCHEPQEEVVFDSIVRTLPDNAVMIEVGAYWSFYSLWFCKVVSQPRPYLIEPAQANLEIGKRNFAHNHFYGDFTLGYVGAAPGKAEDGVDIIALDEFVSDRGLAHIHLLHADVQSFELQMLEGCHSLLTKHAVDYLFISTHTMELHNRCSNHLQKYGYHIIASVDLNETYCVDGILVACSPSIIPPSFDPPSKKSKS